MVASVASADWSGRSPADWGGLVASVTADWSRRPWRIGRGGCRSADFRANGPPGVCFGSGQSHAGYARPHRRGVRRNPCDRPRTHDPRPHRRPPSAGPSPRAAATSRSGSRRGGWTVTGRSAAHGESGSSRRDAVWSRRRIGRVGSPADWSRRFAGGLVASVASVASADWSRRSRRRIGRVGRVGWSRRISCIARMTRHCWCLAAARLLHTGGVKVADRHTSRAADAYSTPAAN